MSWQNSQDLQIVKYLPLYFLSYYEWDSEADAFIWLGNLAPYIPNKMIPLSICGIM